MGRTVSHFRTLLTVGGALLIAATPAFAATSLPTPDAGSSVMVLLVCALRAVLFAGLLFSTIAAIKIPGTGMPEVAVVAFLAALIVPAAANGTAQWYEIVAIVAGITLIAFEVFVIPGLGATGLVGLLLTLGGMILIFVSDPRSTSGHLDLTQVRNALATLIAGGVGGIGAFIGLGRYLPHLPHAHRLILNETNAPDAFGTPWPLPGDVGICLTDLKPGGVARLSHEGVPRNVDVVSDRGYVPAGSAIVVADIEGSRVIVRPESTVEVSIN